MREYPFSALQFPFYEFLKRQALRRSGKNELGFWGNGINGSIAGSIAGFIITPIDVVKTRKMTFQGSSEVPSATSILKQVYSEDGVKGLFKGGAMRVMFLSVGGMMFFGTYETVRKQFTNNE